MNKSIGLTALALLLTACGGGGGGNGGTGSLSLGVTDAPVDDADEVVVSFVGVELRNNADAVLESFTFAEPITVDLLEQQGDQQFFLIQGEELPVGVYDRVSLLVEDMDNASCTQASADPNYPSYIRIDGVKYPLIVPSGGASGFKVQGPITIAAGGSAAYTVDFDLRKSIAERGNTGCYNLRPVLRVVDNARVGTLSGSVDAALLADSACTADALTGAGAAIYVYSGAGVVPDDFDGTAAEPLTTALLTPVIEGESMVGFSYEVGFLLEGNYTVALSCQAGDDAPAPSDDAIAFIQPATVAIVRDTAATVNFEVLTPPAP